MAVSKTTRAPSTTIGSIMERMFISQKLLCRATGLNQGRVSQIVRGITDPTVREKRILEYYFDKDIDQLLEKIES